jgi:biopolymer transport protein ExbD
MVESDNAEMDMTPMIDIVFNLLIFFMVVTDLNQKELADLVLPLAYMAQPDKDNDPDDRIILNVDKDGQIKYRGKVVNLNELGAILHRAKEAYEFKKRQQGESGLEDLPGGGKASKLYVLLRADRDTPWQHVQWLMTIMSEQKLYKMQFATKKFRDAKYAGEIGDILDGMTQEEWQENPRGEG